MCRANKPLVPMLGATLLVLSLLMKLPLWAIVGLQLPFLTTVGGLAVAIFNDGTVRTLAAIMASGATLALMCFLLVIRRAGRAPEA